MFVILWICVNERYRDVLKSKLAPDVQTLMAQKRELTMQLDREQSEKHELFMQVLSLITVLTGIR